MKFNLLYSAFKNKENLLGSAYDADSEGVEGKYYVWDDKELRSVLEKDYNLFAKYFDISVNGNWEGKNILIEKSVKPTKEENEKLKKELENYSFNWSYSENPLNESADFVDRFSSIDDLTSDVKEIFEKNRFSEEYLNELNK